MIFSLLIIHNHDRIPSITRILHTATWDYFTSRLPDSFSHSPKVVKEAIMTDINDLVQEFWRTSSDGDVGASFFAMRSLLEILQGCFDILEVCLILFPSLRLLFDLADKNLQKLANLNPVLNSWEYSDLEHNDEIGAKFKIMFDGYRKMFDLSISKSEDLGDMPRFLPGVVVQKCMSIQGMVDLYRIKPDLLERLIKSTIMIEQLKPFPYSRYILDDYLSGFLQDRDRSQLYYCDPILQHISICRHFLSLLDGSNTFDLQS